MQYKNTVIWNILKHLRVFTVKTVDKYGVVRLSPIISGTREIADFLRSSASDRQYLDIALMGLQNTFPPHCEPGEIILLIDK
jgi:hypothetical protein